MKPDRHKKKQSARYKKAHPEVTSKPEKPSRKSGDTSARISSASVAGSDKDAEGDGRSASAIASQRQGPAFRRREIVSNWQRYETEEDLGQAAVNKGGADFKSLLTQSGISASQFRFKEEKEWEDDNKPIESPFLSLDVNALANSLLAIPLHKRLNIEDVFTEEEIADFNSKAAKHCVEQGKEQQKKRQNPEHLTPDSMDQSSEGHSSRVTDSLLQKLKENLTTS